MNEWKSDHSLWGEREREREREREIGSHGRRVILVEDGVWYCGPPVKITKKLLATPLQPRQWVKKEAIIS